MSITINGATNTLTAASGLTIAGNTAVTGTLSATSVTTITGNNDITSIGGQPHFIVKAGDTNNDFALAAFQTSVGGTIATLGAKATTTGAYPTSVGELHVGIQNAGATADVAIFSPTGLAVTGLLDLSAASSGQIKFPATQNASADANTLDDYEEGTWTPTDASGAALSLTIQFATYTKVGREVTIYADITYPATANGSGATLGGLPFTVAAGEYASLCTWGNNGTVALVTIANAASTTAGVFNHVTGAAVTNAALTASRIIFSGSYFV